MADYTISAGQTGVYEIALTANTAVTVDISNYTTNPANDMQVMVHSGTAAVYAKFGTSVSVKDQAATVVLPNQWVDVLGNPNSAMYTLALISSGAAVVSVYRSHD